MNASTLKLKPGHSLFAPSTETNDNISECMTRCKSKQYTPGPGLNTVSPAAGKLGEKTSEESYQYQRKSSILSY